MNNKVKIIVIIFMILNTATLNFAFIKKDFFEQNLYLLFGLNPGSGIVDNNEVDFITGASQVGIKTGARYEINMLESRHYLETGMDLNYQPQEISYNKMNNNHIGTRDFDLVLLRIPLSYNIHFFRDEAKNPLLITKLSSYFSFLPYKNIRDEGTLPDYSFENYTQEFSLGLTVFPFHSNWGITLEGTRGFKKFYEDEYHQFSDKEKGVYSGVYWGIQYKFKTREQL